MAELVIPRPCVVLLVGAAGAGKSTFARRHFPPDAILSSDAMREAIAGDATDQRVNGPAFAALHRALDRRLARGELAVVDATNATAPARRAVRRVAGRRKVPIVAIVFDLPEAIVRSRNAGRAERPVPDDVVTRHLVALARARDLGTLEAEGYARIVRLRTAAEVDGLVIRLGS
jgi:protein phosphatase